MNTRTSQTLSLRTKSAALGALVGVFAITSQGFAQQASATPEATEEIRIMAPGEAERKIVGRTSIGAPIEVISLSRPVSYADLDLRRQADAAELEKRISDAAKATCKQLDATYPESSLYQSIPADQDCFKTATSKAMAMAKLVIADANQITEEPTDLQTARNK
jgi:UrcA family protein